MVIRPELIDELLKDTNPQELLREDGLLKQLTKALVERYKALRVNPIAAMDTVLKRSKESLVKLPLKYPVSARAALSL